MPIELRVLDLDDGSVSETTLAEFLQVNVDDEATCDDVRGLAVGATVRVGGGAAPAYDITRVL